MDKDTPKEGIVLYFKYLESGLKNYIYLIEAFFSEVLTMADDFDVEAMLEAPYIKEVSWRRVEY